MKVTVDVELTETEAQFAPQLHSILVAVADTVTTRVITDKPTLYTFFRDAVLSSRSDIITAELARRLSAAELYQDCFDVLYPLLLDCTSAATFAAAGFSYKFALESQLLFAPAQLPDPRRLEVNGSVATTTTATASPSQSSPTPMTVPSVEAGSSNLIMTLTVAMARLPEVSRNKLKDDVVNALLKHLLVSRPLDCPREALLPHAEVLAFMMKFSLVVPIAAVITVTKLLGRERSRVAGISLLCKLVENANDVLKRVEPALLDQLRKAVAVAQADIFLYDIEYVSEALGWSGSPRTLYLAHKTCRPSSTFISSFIGSTTGGGASQYAHQTPPLVAAGTGIGPQSSIGPVSGIGVASFPSREVIITGTLDGIITTFDTSATSPTTGLHHFTLSRHSVVSMDFHNRTKVLAVAGSPRPPFGVHSVHPQVTLHVLFEDGRSGSVGWNDCAMLERDHQRIVSQVRWVRTGMKVVTGETSIVQQDSVVRIFDVAKFGGCGPVQEYASHSDFITSMYLPSNNDNLILSGSRDRSIQLHDIRSPSITGMAQMGSTVSALTGEGDYFMAGSLDRRLTLYDVRVPSSILLTRDFESPVISAAFSGGFCAVGTMTGLFLVDMNVVSMPSSRAEGSAGQRFHSVQWSDRLLHPRPFVFGGRDNGTVDIFLRSPDA